MRSLLGALPLSRLEPPVIWAYFKGEVPSDALGELARGRPAGVATLQLGLGLRNVGRAEHRACTTSRPTTAAWPT